ncbi:MAG: DUF503 domain-containing protein [Elusimicrobiota bacterium]
MIVASCRITLYLDEARSLKEKRRVAKGLSQRLRERYNVSVAEVDAETRDLWQKAVLGVALVAPGLGEAETRLDRVLRDVEEWSGVKHVEFEPAYHG